MTTYIFNPAVTEVDYLVVVPAIELEKLGWDFDIDTTDLDIRLSFESNSNETVKCFWAFCIDGADREDSGDDDKSLEDLLFLVNNGIVEYDPYDDYSTEDGHFENWLIEA